MASCLFAGQVVHIRRKPARHRLTYKVFMGLFDLDELEPLSRKTRLFGYNRPGLLSFYDRDHGDSSGAPLRPQVEQALLDAGIAIPGGAIRLLCMPRVLGYVFNPLSAYFCYDIDGNLRAIVHEVNNTFGERHLYALPANIDDEGQCRQHCAKRFRVSPFLPPDLDYRFTITPPGEKTALHISVDRNGEQMLAAWFAGRREPFTAGKLLGLWLRYPGMTFKVFAGIHWEALFMWRKLRRASKLSGSAMQSGGCSR